MSTPTRFIILMSIRSGSTMLATALNSHPEIVCFGELFNLSVEYVSFNVDGFDNDSPSDRALRDHDFPAFLERRVFAGHPPAVRASGFKAMREEAPYFPGLWEWLADQRDLRIINLRRHNLLRSLVSQRIAEATGEWVVTRQPPLTATLPILKPARLAVRATRRLWRRGDALRAQRQTKGISLSTADCCSYFESLEETARKYRAFFEGHPIHDVSYEELVGDQRRGLADVQTFLGVTPRTLSFTTQRQNPEPLSQLITNYDELRREFAATQYALFFED